MAPKRKQPRVEVGLSTGAALSNEKRTDAADTHNSGTGGAIGTSSHCGSLNPVFALTGPRGGCLSTRMAQDMLAELADVVDDGVFEVLSKAWQAVDVPADQYWRVRTSQHDPAGGHTGVGFGKVVTPVLRVPDPRQVQLSFYPTRLEAMAGFGYETRRNMLVMAADKRGGNGSKVFTVLSREAPPARRGEGDSTVRNEASATTADPCAEQAPDAAATAQVAQPLLSATHNSVAAFVDAVPKLYERCLYVLVDEAAPVDPYFDVDCHFIAGEDQVEEKLAFLPDPGHAASHGVGEDVLEAVLAVILERLKRHVESYFCTKVAECLVLTSTVQQEQEPRHPSDHVLRELKLSFHVHFRLHGNDAVATVRDLHQCMVQLRETLDTRLHALAKAPTPLSDDDQKELRELKAVRQCVDFGVYTRWRAFRLPYNVKNPLDKGASFTSVDAAADDLLESQLAHCGVLVDDASLPAVRVGSIASRLMTRVRLSAEPAQRARQQQLLRKMMFCLRALLPVAPGVTQMRADGALKAFLEQHAPPMRACGTPAEKTVSATMQFANVVFDLASIQRDSTAQCPLNLLHARESGAKGGAPSLATATVNPFRVQRPVFPRSVRQTVHDPHRKSLIAEVFRCLSPRYAGKTPAGAPPRPAGTSTVDCFDHVQPALPISSSLRDARPITADGLTVQYEESIRAYYATQKQNKYCLRQNRMHKATYAQLYLTYGSIKVRCYANDCCDRCLYVPWSAPPPASTTTTAAAGLPVVDGYPQFERLQAIHDELFPPLPLDEIVRRYGTEGNAPA